MAKVGGTKQHRPHPLDVIRRARSQYGITAIAVSISCGRDSAVVLDLCVEHFGAANVRPYFMYHVPDISFQQRYLAHVERRYGISVFQFPHWALARIFRGTAFRHPTRSSTSLRRMRLCHSDAYVRENLVVEWIASGEKSRDSIERNAQISPCNGISEKRHRFWPLATWSDADVSAYAARHHMVQPPDYRLKPPSGMRENSFSTLLWASELIPIAEHYPEDFERICSLFPLARGQVQRAKQAPKRQQET